MKRKIPTVINGVTSVTPFPFSQALSRDKADTIILDVDVLSFLYFNLLSQSDNLVPNKKTQKNNWRL